MKSYMAEVEQIDATRKQKAIAASQRKNAAFDDKGELVYESTYARPVSCTVLCAAPSAQMSPSDAARVLGTTDCFERQQPKRSNPFKTDGRSHRRTTSLDSSDADGQREIEGTELTTIWILGTTRGSG